jgi:hypothetical protein
MSILYTEYRISCDDVNIRLVTFQLSRGSRTRRETRGNPWREVVPRNARPKIRTAGFLALEHGFEAGWDADAPRSRRDSQCDTVLGTTVETGSEQSQECGGPPTPNHARGVHGL